jgi:hypothetical protein
MVHSALMAIDLPPRLRSSFTVTVFHDYAPARSTLVSEIHQRFFAQLIQALSDCRPFRGMSGPPDPDHRTHLHLDMAPWPYRRLTPPAALTPSGVSRVD